MATDEVSKGGAAGDVDNIRKILFGDQISQMEERFSQDETAIAQLRAENRNLRQALEAELTQRESSLEELKQLFLSTLEQKQKIIEEKILAEHEEKEAGIQAALAAQKRLLDTIAQAFEQYLKEVRTDPSKPK